MEEQNQEIDYLKYGIEHHKEITMKRKVEKYIVTKGTKIIKVYYSAEGIEGPRGIKQSLKNQKIFDYDDIQIVPETSDHKPTYDIREFEDNKLRPEEERIIEGLRPVPKGKKVSKGQIIEKTDAELLRDGDRILGDNEVFDENTEKIRSKTEEEMEVEYLATLSKEEKDKYLEDKLIEEEIKLIDEEKRNEARIRLIDKGLIKVEDDKSVKGE